MGGGAPVAVVFATARVGTSRVRERARLPSACLARGFTSPRAVPFALKASFVAFLLSLNGESAFFAEVPVRRECFLLSWGTRAFGLWAASPRVHLMRFGRLAARVDIVYILTEKAGLHFRSVDFIRCALWISVA